MSLSSILTWYLHEEGSQKSIGFWWIQTCGSFALKVQARWKDTECRELVLSTQFSNQTYAMDEISYFM